jgi:ATP-dependent DNA ligase
MKLITMLNKQNGKLYKTVCLQHITEEEAQVFEAAYNPYKMYHQKFTDYDMDNLGEPNQMMFNLLERLTTRRHTGQEARQAVENHAKAFGDLIKLICNKDLRCGVTATTFNKVYPGTIPQFNVQLAKEVPINTLVYPQMAQIKYDGVRLIAIKKKGKVTFRTRNGKEVNLPILRWALEQTQHDNYIIDGEIVYGEGKLTGRTSISGAINSAMHGGAVDEADMIYHVFDSMPLNDWEANVCDYEYQHRLHIMLEMLVSWQIPNVLPAYTAVVSSAEETNLIYDIYVEQGYEGIILKHADHKYTFKRSKDWVKVKETKTADLKCVGMIMGEGKYEGQVGSLTVRGIVEDKEVLVNVGSGLSDEDRALGWDYYEGQILEIKYNSVIPNHAKDGYSLFLPRFVCVRHDK